MSLFDTTSWACTEEHTPPLGPNEDIAQCSRCGSPTSVLRPEGETIGFHAPDCSLPERHRGVCQPGGEGHPPAPVIRGFWPGMDDDIAAERARWANKASTSWTHGQGVAP